VSQIAFDHYGRHSSLVLDLIQEFNPDLRDLDVVATGQKLVLPPLSLDALLRRRADGSYRLIVSAHPTVGAATRAAQAVRAHGYAAAVSPRDVGADRKLYRVEINALKNRAAAVRAWEIAKRQDWLELGVDAADRR
jgi:hypothetical protein